MERYELNELVLARDGQLFYDARVIAIKNESPSKSSYRIHYQNWNKRYDTWLNSDCLKKYNDCNLKLKNQPEEEFKNSSPAELKRRAKSMKTNKFSNKSKIEKKSSSSPVIKKSLSVSCTKLEIQDYCTASIRDVVDGMKPVIISIKKTALDPLSAGCDTDSQVCSPQESSNSHVTEEVNADDLSDVEVPAIGVSGIIPLAEACVAENLSENVETCVISNLSDQQNPLAFENQYLPCRKTEDCKIFLPDILRTFVTDDYYKLKMKQKMLVLPANPSFDQILSKYEQHQLKIGKNESETHEFVTCLTEYLNVLLDKDLLYRFEKKRHSEVMKKNEGIPYSKIYGIVHLLRLIKNIGTYIDEAIHNSEIKSLLESHFLELLNYIEDNTADLISDDIYLDWQDQSTN